MSIRDRIAIWIAWHLPRLVAEWTFRRVAEAGEAGRPLDRNPFDQFVHEPLERWRRHSAGGPPLDDPPTTSVGDYLLHGDGRDPNGAASEKGPVGP